MWKKIGAFGCAGLLVAFLVALIWFGIEVAWPLYLSGKQITDFPAEVRKHVDPVELQKWAHRMIAAHPIDPGAGNYQIPVEELPASLISFGQLKPEMAFISQQEPDEKPAVEIVWGGGFGHWGLIVGEKDLTVSDDETEVVTRWIDGVYFFREK